MYHCDNTDSVEKFTQEKCHVLSSSRNIVDYVRGLEIKEIVPFYHENSTPQCPDNEKEGWGPSFYFFVLLILISQFGLDLRQCICENMIYSCFFASLSSPL